MKNINTQHVALCAVLVGCACGGELDARTPHAGVRRFQQSSSASRNMAPEMPSQEEVKAYLEKNDNVMKELLEQGANAAIAAKAEDLPAFLSKHYAGAASAQCSTHMLVSTALTVTATRVGALQSKAPLSSSSRTQRRTRWRRS